MLYYEWIAEVHKLFTKYFHVDSTKWDVTFLYQCWECGMSVKDAVDAEIGTWTIHV